MRNWTRFAILLTLMAVTAAACGKTEDTESPPSAAATCKTGGPSITIGGFNFPESSTLAEIYAQALKAKGCDAKTKLNIGARDIVQPALEKGDIDMVPEYLATFLEYRNKGAGEATGDVQATFAKLQERLQGSGIQALTPSSAQDKNEIVVTKETAQKYSLSKVSDLAPVANKLVFGGPPECNKRPFCAIGLKKTYNIEFKELKKLDVGGPLTVAALDGGQIDVGLLFTTDPVISQKGFVILEDDQQLQGADNVVPVLRAAVVTAHGQALVDFINSISAKITSEGLLALNKQTGVDHEEPADVATKWLKDQGITT